MNIESLHTHCFHGNLFQIEEFNFVLNKSLDIPIECSSGSVPFSLNPLRRFRLFSTTFVVYSRFLPFVFQFWYFLFLRSTMSNSSWISLISPIKIRISFNDFLDCHRYVIIRLSVLGLSWNYSEIEHFIGFMRRVLVLAYDFHFYRWMTY